MTTETTPTAPVDAAAAVAKDALYIAVGFGVLAFQKVQVRRHELTKRLAAGAVPVELPTAEQVRSRLHDGAVAVDGRVREVEARVDAALDQVQHRLPAQAADLLGQVRHVGTVYRERVRTLAGLNA
jgi:hypothetical protein